MDSKKITVTLLSCLLFSIPREGTASPNSPPPIVSMVKSVLVPGLGEFGLKSVTRGRLFSGMELLLWAGLLESGAAVSLHTGRLESLASVHAGTDISGMDNRYVVNVGDYNSMDLYNESRQRQRDRKRVYRDRTRFYWSWDDEDNRKEFRQFRIKRDRARKVGQFLVGALVLNRIVSVIDVRYLHAVRENAEGLSIRPAVHRGRLSPGVTVAWHF